MNKKSFFAVLMVLTIFFGWHCTYQKIAPDELVGTWKTSAPQYSDRFIKIGRDAVAFGTGGENFETYSIKKISIKKSQKESSIFYTIHYKNRERVWDQFAFYYSPVNGGVISLKNQRQILWTKEKDER